MFKSASWQVGVALIAIVVVGQSIGPKLVAAQVQLPGVTVTQPFVQLENGTTLAPAAPPAYASPAYVNPQVRTGYYYPQPAYGYYSRYNAYPRAYWWGPNRRAARRGWYR
jgi:hypothetical protein